MSFLFWYILIILVIAYFSKDCSKKEDNWRDGPSDWLLHEHNEKEFEYELKSKYEKD